MRKAEKKKKNVQPVFIPGYPNDHKIGVAKSYSQAKKMAESYAGPKCNFRWGGGYPFPF
jgi:hypothetical protein